MRGDGIFAVASISGLDLQLAMMVGQKVTKIQLVSKISEAATATAAGTIYKKFENHLPRWDDNKSTSRDFQKKIISNFTKTRIWLFSMIDQCVCGDLHISS